MRAIDGDALIADCKKYLAILNPDGDAKEYARIFWLIGILRNAPTIEPERKWIPVEERLPKQNEMVLITIIRKDERYNKIPFISIGYISWNNTVWWCAHDGDCKLANVEVLAWMPLPEPYRAERRTDEGSD